MPKKLLTLIVGVVFVVFAFVGVTGKAQAQYPAHCQSLCERDPNSSACTGCTSSVNRGIAAYDDFKAAVDQEKVAREKHSLGVFGDLQASIIYYTADGGEDLAFIPSMTNMIAGMYDAPPATTDRYIADVLDSAKIVPTAYAQGLGFASLSPILEAWKIFRNIAYFFFIAIFLAIGFMIMFRQKIGGQTAVTAQQAIPRVIVALLAVTFSYAIAGLLIDIMYIFMYLLVGLFGESRNLVQSSIFNVGIDLITGRGDSVNGVFDDTYGAVSTFVESLMAGAGGALSQVAGALTGLTAAVIIVIALAISIFRLFFELLKTYIEIIISITTAPFVLMLGAIPGKNSFVSWVKGLIGNLSAFPIVLVVLIIYNKLTESIGSSGEGFMPPYLIGNGDSGALSVMIGLGILMLATDLVKEGKKAFGASGGIFEQFKGPLADSIKRGWTGGELIPGVAATDTSKWAQQSLGGISGENIARKMGIGAVMGGGTVLGGGLSALKKVGVATTGRGRASIRKGLRSGLRAGRAVGEATQDPTYKFLEERRKKRKEDNKSPI